MNTINVSNLSESDANQTRRTLNNKQVARRPLENMSEQTITRVKRRAAKESRESRIVSLALKVRELRNGHTFLAINQKSNKPHASVRVSASLARKLTGKN